MIKISIGIAIICWLVIEALVTLLYAATAQVFLGRAGFDIRSILKGAFERVFLTVSLYLNYSQALTLFSALKLATRLKHVEKTVSKAEADQAPVDGSVTTNPNPENSFNDYYLVGNLLSVLLSVLYVWLIKKYVVID
jgi:hypothetical protein